MAELLASMTCRFSKILILLPYMEWWTTLEMSNFKPWYWGDIKPSFIYHFTYFINISLKGLSRQVCTIQYYILLISETQHCLWTTFCTLVGRFPGFLERKKIYLFTRIFSHVDKRFFIPVMDCRLSEWSTWSGCDSNCGRGAARRSRHVIHPAANGGAECEALDQTRSCTGEGDCSSRKNREIVSAFSGKYSVFFHENTKKWGENARKTTFSRKCDAPAGQVRPEASEELRRETQPQELQEARHQRPVSFLTPYNNHRLNMELDLVYLGSVAQLYSLAEMPPPPPIWAYINEGAIGHPR